MTASQTEVDGAARPKGLARYLRAFGPGLITGASDDDPSGIATYSQAGARIRPLVDLERAAHVPTDGRHPRNLRSNHARQRQGTRGVGPSAVLPPAGRSSRILIAALLCANALNIAADLLAIGSGMDLLGLGPPSVWAVIAGATIIALLIGGSFTRISTVFKVLALSLLAYIPVVFLSDVSWSAVARNLFIPHPHASREYLLLLVAVLGTTISPYLFFGRARIESRSFATRSSGETGRCLCANDPAMRPGKNSASAASMCSAAWPFRTS